jgi:hypothetical protein
MSINEKEKSLFDFFKNREEKETISIDSQDEMQIKNAVFSTIGSAEIMADIFELFTIKFIQAHSEVIDSLAPEYTHDEESLHRYMEYKYKESKI